MIRIKKMLKNGNRMVSCTVSRALVSHGSVNGDHHSRDLGPDGNEPNSNTIRILSRFITFSMKI